MLLENITSVPPMFFVDPQASPNRVPNRGFEVRNKQISVPRAIGFKANFGDGKERWKPPGSWGG